MRLVFVQAYAFEMVRPSSVFASGAPHPDRDPSPDKSRRKQPNELNNKTAGECQRTSPAEPSSGRWLALRIQACGCTLARCRCLDCPVSARSSEVALERHGLFRVAYGWRLDAACRRGKHAIERAHFRTPALDISRKPCIILGHIQQRSFWTPLSSWQLSRVLAASEPFCAAFLVWPAGFSFE